MAEGLNVQPTTAYTQEALADPANRGTALDRLASEGMRGAAESLRHVLPIDEVGRVAVAAFGSSV